MTYREPKEAIVELGARVHLFVQPGVREEFTSPFRDVLGCEVGERDFGLAYPILLVAFDNGSRFSVEFTELAPPEVTGRAIDDEQAFRGARIEFRMTDREGYQQKLRSAGVPAFKHPGGAHTYFNATGGQVFRLIDVAYDGP